MKTIGLLALGASCGAIAALAWCGWLYVRAMDLRALEAARRAARPAAAPDTRGTAP